MSEQTSSEQASRPRFDLGILFVHGIGQQTTGETLTSTAGSLLAWLGQNGVIVESDQTVLKPSGTGTAFSEVTLCYGAEEKKLKVLLLESCWAETFACPPTLEFAKWIYGPGSSILVRQLAEWLIEIQFRISDLFRNLFRRARPPSSSDLGASPADSLPNTDGFPFFKGLFIGACALVVIPFFQIMILLLACLSTIPLLKIGAVAGKALRGLASTLGDAEVFCQGLLGRGAIRTRVREDLRFLKENCSQTTLAAHSQGAAVALEAVSSLGHRPDLLVTYGSGWRKLHQLHDIGKRDLVTSYCEFILPVVMAMAICLALTDSKLMFSFLILVYIFAVLTGLQAVEQAMGVESQLLSRMKTILGPGDGMRWVDMVATLDPVPAGILLKWMNRDERKRTGRWITWKQFGDSFRTCLVVNSENPFSDHTSYWQSSDFLRSFAAVLAGQNMPVCGEAAFAEDPWSFRLQRLRCQLRNVCHLAVCGLAAYLYWRTASEVQGALPLFLPWVARGLRSVWAGLETYAPAVAWLAGALLMIGAAASWTRLVSGRLWKAWDQYRVLHSNARRAVDVGLMLLYLLSIWLPLEILYAGVRSGRIEAAGHEAEILAGLASATSVELILWAVTLIVLAIPVVWLISRIRDRSLRRKIGSPG